MRSAFISSAVCCLTAAIGADVIVGFPGETDEDFDVTLEFIARLPLTYLHVFSFSTQTRNRDCQARLKLWIPMRSRNALAPYGRFRQRKTAAFRADQAGRSVRALTLARIGEEWTEALTANYLKVRLAGRHAANKWHDIRIPNGRRVWPIPRRSCLALENDLSEREVAAVRDGEGNFLYSETVGELARDAREI